MVGEREVPDATETGSWFLGEPICWTLNTHSPLITKLSKNRNNIPGRIGEGSTELHTGEGGWSFSQAPSPTDAFFGSRVG